MEPDADLAAVERLIGDPNRARLLQILLGGTPQSGSSLAAAAGISRSLASAHLKKLVAGGLVRAERSGRQRYRAGKARWLFQDHRPNARPMPVPARER